MRKIKHSNKPSGRSTWWYTPSARCFHQITNSSRVSRGRSKNNAGDLMSSMTQALIHLSEISIDEDCFSKAAPLYQKALDGSGCNHKLAFSVPLAQSPNSGRRNRYRDIIWYNPPLSRNVATTVGRSFLKIPDEEFPKGHALHNIFNRNTVQISYSCILNLKQKIDGHNKSTLWKINAAPPKACNCHQLAHCPLDGNCLKSAVIYQATVATEDNRPAETYVGLTENSFKTRYSNHKSSFRDPNKRLSTELSKHIWPLKDAKIGFSLTWKILKQAVPFNPASKRCNLCLWKKIFHYLQSRSGELEQTKWTCNFMQACA